jgi:hypothetical protein
MTAAWLAGEWAASVRGGIALLIAWAFCGLPRVPAAVRCWAWRAAYGVLIVSFCWTTPIDLPMRQDGTMNGDIVAREGARNKAADVIGGGTPVAARPPMTSAALLRPSDHARPATTPAWPTVAFAGWLAFVTLYAGRLFLGWARACQLRSGPLMPVPELAELCRRMGIRRPPGVRRHPAVGGPLLVGLWRPVIVLPEPPPAQLRLVLAHELAHLRRRDLLWNWVSVVAIALLPLHPLVWLCNRRWRLAAEAAADAEAVTVTATDAANYGRLIVSVATAGRAPGVLSVAAAAESRWVLERRLSAMAHITHWNKRRLVTAGITLGAVGAAAAVPWRVVAQEPPPPATTRPSGVVPPAAAAFVSYTADWVRFEADLTKTLNAIHTPDDATAARPALEGLKHRRAELRERLRLLGDMDRSTSRAAYAKIGGPQQIDAFRFLIGQLAHTRDQPQLRAMLGAQLDQLDLTTPSLFSTTGDSAKPAPALVPNRAANVATSDPFPFAVPFEAGASQFDPGDRITIAEVRGTAADMAGGIYHVSGTYTLASRDSATLAASVTARDAADGKGPWNAAQRMTIKKGSGTFTLLLPVSIRGWPHVSFYGKDDAFGGVYFGTGDTVLRKWWGE